METFIDSTSNQACVSIQNDALCVTIDGSKVSISQVSTVCIKQVIDGLMLLESHNRGIKEMLLAGSNPAFVLKSRVISGLTYGWRSDSRTHMIFEDDVYAIKNFRNVDVVVAPVSISREDKSALMRVAVRLLQASLR